MKHVRRTTRAFTLVELLVVVGLIAVLLAILLPVMSRAREQSMRIACMNNHKQLVLAVRLYAHEWNGVLPFANSAWGENGGWSGPGWLYRASPSKKGGGKSYPEDVQSGTLWPFVNSREVYRCPMDQRPKLDFRNPVRNLSSYLMNANLNGTNPLTLYKISQFKTDDIVFWELDETRPGVLWMDGTTMPTDGLSRRHGLLADDYALGVVSCMDGHIEWMTTAQFNAEAARKPSRLNCSPRQR